MIYYSKAIEQDKNYFSPVYYRAILYATKTNDFKKAHLDFDQSIAIDSQYKEAYLYHARLYAQEKEFGKSKDILDKLIAMFPNYADAYLDRGIVWYNIGVLNMVCKDFDKAESLGNKQASDYKKQWCK